MKTAFADTKSSLEKAEPVCPVFGICGGCDYQDVTYESELKHKESRLRYLFEQAFGSETETWFRPIVASPEPYFYRHRLDIGLYRRKDGEVLMGFMREGKHRIVSIESCSIARREIVDFMPELKEQALKKLPEDYRTANLVVKTGDDGRVYWGGIGRRSLQQSPEDYLWTEIEGKRIFYSLETFFQANLQILPALLKTIRSFGLLNEKTVLFDLYSGVGLFGIPFAQDVGRVVMVEDCPGSVKLAQYNLQFHGCQDKIQMRPGRVEDQLLSLLKLFPGEKRGAIIDPPRKGCSPEVIQVLSESSKQEGTSLDWLFYLSCSPESLVRDMKALLSSGWRVEHIIPFDFFPRTRHLETLVLLVPDRAE